MLKKLFLSVFFIVASFAGAAEISPQEALYVERLSETIDHLKAKQDEVWPGYDISLTPIVVSFGSGHIYAFNLNSKNPIWEAKQIKGKKILFSSQDPWGITAVAMQDQFPLEDEEVFAFNVGLMQKKGQPDYLPLLVIVHELFHRYQFNEFLEDASFANYQDRENSDNLALINLEERILIDFLRAKDHEKLEHLKDFVAIHKVRTAMMNSSSVNWEDGQQRMEGLADYVSIKAQDTFNLIPEFSGQEHIGKTLEGYIKNGDVAELAVKWRHYGVGAALGYGLDYVHAANWKEKVERNGISLAKQLEESIPLSSLEISRRAWKAKQHYKYKKIKSQIVARAKSNQENMTALINGYQEQKGVVLVIQRPRDVGINGGGKTGGIYHLPDGSTVSVNDSSVSASTDNLWKVEVKRMPYLFQKGNDRWMKIDEEVAIEINGKSYGMNDLFQRGGNINFDRISLKGASCNFESMDRSGHLEVKNGMVKIVF